MHTPKRTVEISQAPSSLPQRWPWLLATACGLALLTLLWQKRTDNPPAPSNKNVSSPVSTSGSSSAQTPFALQAPAAPADLGPEETVAAKLRQFARSRRSLADALARRHNVQMPAEVAQFFAAVEGGNWDEIENAFKQISGGDDSAGHNNTRSPEVSQLWPAIIDAYGVAEQVHLWPPAQLLDYGNAVLAALRPGMVYVGGTDNGRWIPELLNETSEGEHHIVITQNGLAAADYQEYIRLQYDDQMANLSEEESKRAFDDYVSDAKKRLLHDQQFPAEPRQILPGEDVQMVDGKIEVGGRIAVMAINEKLLQTLMLKNPDLTFALQESFPLRGTYPDALPLGPLMELGARDDQHAFSPDRAAQSVEYWRNRAEAVLADPQASSAALLSYSHDTVAAANLLSSHGFGREAEEAYRLAARLSPSNPEAVQGVTDLLVRAGQADEAQKMVADFTQKYPEQSKVLERLKVSFRIVRTTESKEN